MPPKWRTIIYREKTVQMNLDSLVSNVANGNINTPSAVVLVVLIIAIAAVLITIINNIKDII